MIHATDILGVVKELGGPVETRGGIFSCARVRAARTDYEARARDVAWTKRMKDGEFRGSVLLCSDDLKPANRQFFIRCENPRRAMIRVINRLLVPAAPRWLRRPNNVWAASALIEDTSIGPNTVIANARISGARIGANCSIGLCGFGFEDGERFPHVGGVVVEPGVEIGSNVCIDRGALGDTVIKSGTKIDNLVHIAHNCIIGPNATIVANSMIAGSTVIGEGVWVAPSASVLNKLTVSDNALLGMGAVVIKDVEREATMVGNPARRIR